MAYGCREAWGDVPVAAGEGSGEDGCEAGEIIQVRVGFVVESFLDVAKDADPGIVIRGFVAILRRRSRSSVILVGQEEGNVVLDSLNPW